MAKRKNINYDFSNIEKNSEGTTYYMEVELEPNTEKWMKVDIAWNEKDENHKSTVTSIAPEATP